MNFQNQFIQAAHLGQEGGEALSRGDGNQACQKFKASLEILENVSVAIEQETDPKDAVQVLSNTLTPYAIPNLCSGDFFVCNKALIFDVTDCQAVNSVNVALLTLVTLYNMALAYHQRGMSTGSTKMFQFAYRIYDQCLQLCAVLPENELTDVDVLSIMILNNVAHVYQCAGEYNKAMDTLQRMNAFAHCSSPSLQNLEFFDEILLNIMVGKSPRAAACA
jgi:tetratricopeptide (TPR) repeat protein